MSLLSFTNSNKSFYAYNYNKKREEMKGKNNIILKFIKYIIVISKILLLYKCVRRFFNCFHGVLHLIVYFCALEMMPDLFLWKGIGLINRIILKN